jgi:hypothetical protein
MSTARARMEILHCTRLASEFIDCSYLFISIIDFFKLNTLEMSESENAHNFSCTT